MTLVRVDGSPSSAVYVCRLCGCRDVFTARQVALRAAAHHLDVAHGERAAAGVLAARAAAATRRAGHRISDPPPELHP